MNSDNCLLKAARTIYEILSGVKIGAELKHALLAGHATIEEGKEYYEVRLMLFPGITYYMTKNKDSMTQYTVFAKRIQNSEGKCKFQNPVGMGELRDSYIEIRFPLIRADLYMNLFPKMTIEGNLSA